MKINYDESKFNGVVNEFLPSAGSSNFINGQSIKTILVISKIYPDLPFTPDENLKINLEYEVINSNNMSSFYNSRNY